jgi:hypothetical protein
MFFIKFEYLKISISNTPQQYSPDSIFELKTTVWTVVWGVFSKIKLKKWVSIEILRFQMIPRNKVISLIATTNT